MRAILDVVLLLLDLYQYVLIVAAVMSWLIAFSVVNMRNQFVSVIYDVLYRFTEPLLAPIRRRLPPFGGLDLSFIVLFLLVILLQRVIVYYIYPNVF